MGKSAISRKTLAFSGDGKKICASGGFKPTRDSNTPTYVASFTATDYWSKITSPRYVVYNSLGYSSSMSDDGGLLLVLSHGQRTGENSIGVLGGASLSAFGRIGQKCFEITAQGNLLEYLGSYSQYWNSNYSLPDGFDTNPVLCVGFYTFNGATAAVALYGAYRYNVTKSVSISLDSNGAYSSFNNGKNYTGPNDYFAIANLKDGFGKGLAISKDCNTAALGSIANTGCAVIIGSSNYLSGNYIDGFIFTTVLKPVYTPPFPGIYFDSLFGYSISLSDNGTKMAVGAPNSYDVTFSPAVKKGIVYYYTLASDPNTRLKTVVGDPLKITASNQLADTYFGYNVKLSPDGTMIIVGCPRENSDAGAVYVYKINNNVATQTQKIISPDGGRYGAAISFVNNKVLISAPACTVDGKFAAGRIYQYVSTGNTLTFVKKIQMPDPKPCDFFGMALDRSIVGTDKYGIEDVIVSGAYGRTSSGPLNADCTDSRVLINTIGTVRGFFNPPT